MAYVVHSGYAFAIIPYVIWYFVCRFRFVSFVFSLILGISSCARKRGYFIFQLRFIDQEIMLSKKSRRNFYYKLQCFLFGSLVCNITNELLQKPNFISHLIVVAYTWYFSLSRTTLSANTAIYNCSPALVYFFSIFILNDSITPLKVFSVIACVGGILNFFSLRYNTVILTG